jgi:hypothetical protein
MNEIAVKRAHQDGWSRIVPVLIVGYCLMGRSFAYLGIPPWHLFIGEIILAAFLVAGPRTVRGAWLGVARRVTRLRRLIKFFLILLAFGVFQVLHGIGMGYPPLIALRDFAFNYYPVFFLLGLWAGVRDPNLPPRLFRLLAWFNGVYGVIYILFLNRLSWSFPGVSEQVGAVPIFGLPEFSFVVLLGLLAYEPNLRKVWHLMVLNTFVLLGMQVRAEWVGLAAGFLLWGLLTKRLKRILAGSAAVVLLLAVMFFIDFRLPGPTSRGGEITARDLVGRALAPLDPDLAAEYNPSYMTYVGTALWRTVWWAAIWESVNQSRETSFFGFGYGYPLGDLVPYLEGEFIRTPHNAFFYVLGYTGWIGVGLFALFQGELVLLLWRAYRHSGHPIGVVLWVAMLAYAQFTAFFEAPYGAIPFYLLFGLILGSGTVNGGGRIRMNPTTGLPGVAQHPNAPLVPVGGE